MEYQKGCKPDLPVTESGGAQFGIRCCNADVQALRAHFTQKYNIHHSLMLVLLGSMFHSVFNNFASNM
jgi:hypothetical protein